MVTIGNIEIKENDKLEVLGKTFVVWIESSLAGDFVVWSEENNLMRIYATPNYEIEGVIVQVDYDINNITSGWYEGKLNGYEHYKQIVKEQIEKLLTNLPKCDCRVSHESIDMKGWNQKICSYCYRVIDEENNKEKDKLNKKTVVDELNKILDEYFVKKFKELNLEYGDMAPDQTLIFDDSVEKIADIVLQWATLNKKVGGINGTNKK